MYVLIQNGTERLGIIKNRGKNYCSWKRTFCTFWRF